MKIVVSYTENEVVSTVNTIADVANELAASVGSDKRISSEERNRVLTKIKNGTLANESHSPAIDATMTSSELVIDIRDEAYLDALKFVMKAVNIFAPFIGVIGGMVNILKGAVSNVELLKEHYNTVREKWTVKDDAKRYVVASVGYEGMKFRVICCNDGYNKSVYAIHSNTMSDAADSFTDVLFNLYSEKVKEFDDSVFTLTKEEADAKSKKW